LPSMSATATPLPAPALAPVSMPTPTLPRPSSATGAGSVTPLPSPSSSAGASLPSLPNTGAHAHLSDPHTAVSQSGLAPAPSVMPANPSSVAPSAGGGSSSLGGAASAPSMPMPMPMPMHMPARPGMPAQNHPQQQQQQQMPQQKMPGQQQQQQHQQAPLPASAPKSAMPPISTNGPSLPRAPSAASSSSSSSSSSSAQPSTESSTAAASSSADDASLLSAFVLRPFRDTLLFALHCLALISVALFLLSLAAFLGAHPAHPSGSMLTSAPLFSHRHLHRVSEWLRPPEHGSAFERAHVGGDSFSGSFGLGGTDDGFGGSDYADHLGESVGSGGGGWSGADESAAAFQTRALAEVYDEPKFMPCVMVCVRAISFVMIFTLLSPRWA
jgi:hypothetical protein